MTLYMTIEPIHLLSQVKCVKVIVCLKSSTRTFYLSLYITADDSDAAVTVTITRVVSIVTQV